MFDSLIFAESISARKTRRVLARLSAIFLIVFSVTFSLELKANDNWKHPTCADAFRQKIDVFANNGYDSRNLPYLIMPRSGVVKKVVIAVHGLSDSPHSLRDVVEPLAQTTNDDTAVLGVLLSGHGEIFAPQMGTWNDHHDLMHISEALHEVRLADWQSDVDDAIATARSLGGENTPEIQAVGFSTGAALVVDAMIRQPGTISKAVFIAPLFGFHRSSARWAHIGKYIIPYSSKSTGGSFFTYPKISNSAIAESYKLVEGIRPHLNAPLGIPVAVIGSESDTTVSNQSLQEFIKAQRIEPENVYFIPRDTPTTATTDGEIDDSNGIRHHNVPLRTLHPQNTPNPVFPEVQRRTIEFLSSEH